jgi:hypothetical protein
VEFSGVTIDPGEYTAFAIWDKSRLKHIFTYDLSSATDAGRIDKLSKLYGDARLHFPSKQVIIEDQSLWTGSAKSMASGARGDIFTTAKIAGVLAFFFLGNKNKVSFVQPITWKGNLNNKQLRRILQIKFNFIPNNDHEANAYGIGLYAQDLF